MPIKFGCHDFLNSRPYTHAFTKEGAEIPFELTLAPPAELADMLKDGTLDMAFIPAIEYARIPGLRIIPGIGIAAVGEVRTVLMVSNKRVWDIERVALDKRSRTSVALIKILLKEYFRVDARMVGAKNNDPAEMLETADAGLIIGDEAFKVDRQKYQVVDLSQAWLAFTGKPFVFAILCVREGVDEEEVRRAVTALNTAKKKFEDVLPTACKEAAESLGISEEEATAYLTKHIRYNLDSDQQEGLNAFYEIATRHHLIDKKPELNFFY